MNFFQVVRVVLLAVGVMIVWIGLVVAGLMFGVYKAVGSYFEALATCVSLETPKR